VSIGSANVGTGSIVDGAGPGVRRGVGFTRDGDGDGVGEGDGDGVGEGDGVGVGDGFWQNGGGKQVFDGSGEGDSDADGDGLADSWPYAGAVPSRASDNTGATTQTRTTQRTMTLPAQW
jgi:hypothetical protein